jgi:sulfonate transport system permease protein
MRLPPGLVPWLLPLFLLVAWQVSAAAGWLPPTILPAPSSVLTALGEVIASGDLGRHMAASAARALTGLAIGGGLGFLFGLLNGLSRPLGDVTDTTIQMLRTIPHLALIPLVILWFGIDETARIFLVAIGVFFPIYINTMYGIRNVDPQLVEMGRVYGMGRGRLIREILLPGALPSIFVGLRYALGIMWLTLIVAETIAADSGIGYMAMQAREFLRIDIVVLAILIYALLGKLADSLTRLLERRLLTWNAAYAG